MTSVTSTLVKTIDRYDSRRRIREINPTLHDDVLRNINSAPDPRPATVKNAYDEQWSSELVWNRLLHELEVLSIDSDGATILEDLQNTNLAKRLHLKEHLVQWYKEYPMLWWTLGFMFPLQMLYAKTAIGEIKSKDISSEQITLTLIDHLRDRTTAEILRSLASSCNKIPDTQKSLLSNLKTRKLGRLYWILTTITPEYDVVLVKSITNVIEDDEDEEFLLPFIRTGSSGMISNAINVVEKIAQDDISISTTAFPLFSRWLWDSFLLNYILESSAISPVCMFIRSISGRYTFIDEEFAAYILSGYLQRVEDGTISYVSETLSMFMTNRYAEIWKLFIPYLKNERCAIIGDISISAHHMGLEDIAKYYKEVFLRLYLSYSSDNRYWNFASYNNPNGITYLYDSLPRNAQRNLLVHMLFYAVSYSYYEVALKDDNSDGLRRQIAINFITIILSLSDGLTILTPSLLAIILLELSTEDIYTIIKDIDSQSIPFYNDNLTIFVRSLPIEFLSEKLWIVYVQYIPLFRVLIERLVLSPSILMTILSVDHDVGGRILSNILNELSTDVMKNASVGGHLINLNINIALQIAQKFNISINMILGDNFYRTIKKIFKSYTAWNQIIETIDESAIEWSVLLPLYLKNSLYLSEKVLITMMKKGVDPSYKSSIILLKIIGQQLSDKEKQTLLRIVVTHKSLAKLSVGQRREVDTLLEKPL